MMDKAALEAAVWAAVTKHIDACVVDGLNTDGEYVATIETVQLNYRAGLEVGRLAASNAVKIAALPSPGEAEPRLPQNEISRGLSPEFLEDRYGPVVHLKLPVGYGDVAAPPSEREVIEAGLLAAKELAKTMEGLTGCRGDDDYVWGAQEKIAAALRSLASGGTP